MKSVRSFIYRGEREEYLHLQSVGYLIDVDHAGEVAAVFDGILNTEMFRVTRARMASIAIAIDRQDFLGDIQQKAVRDGVKTLLLSSGD